MNFRLKFSVKKLRQSPHSENFHPKLSPAATAVAKVFRRTSELKFEYRREIGLGNDHVSVSAVRLII